MLISILNLVSNYCFTNDPEFGSPIIFIGLILIKYVNCYPLEWPTQGSLVVAPDVRPSGGVGLTSDDWRQPLVMSDVRLFFLKKKFRGKKIKKTFLIFSLKKGPLGCSGGTVYVYRTPLVGSTVKTNTKDIQVVWDSRFRLLEDNWRESNKS